MTLTSILVAALVALVVLLLGRTWTRLDRVEDRLTGVEGRLTGVEGRLTGVEGRLTGVEQGQEALVQTLRSFRVEMLQRLDLIAERVSRLEGTT